MKGNNMNTDKYAKLNNEVDSLIAETNKKMLKAANKQLNLKI